MTRVEEAWAKALEEHDTALRAYVQRARATPAERWVVPRAPGKWSPAAEALHMVKAYESGAPTTDGQAMRLVSSPLSAWLARTFYLPVMLGTRTFPRNAPAPREVRPDAELAHVIPRDELLRRLDEAAGRAAVELRSAATRTPNLRVVHAYFGGLPPLTALRLLSAHTRHHTKLNDP